MKQKEATAKARKQFEKDRFEAKQAMRKKMIDRVSGRSEAQREQLASRASSWLVEEPEHVASLC